MYLWYSFSVVAPMQWSSPLASIGLSKLPASIAPSVFPAPTIVWSSSINIIVWPSLFFISFNTAFNLSSNSPLYFAPATSAPRSSEKIFRSFKLLGTSPFAILIARPSTMAVLPTPASPIKTGLFFVFLESIRIVFLISLSRPITGSIFWFFASETSSVPYFSKTLYVDSGLSVTTLVFPLILLNSLIKLSFVKLNSLKISFNKLSGFSKNAIKICSTETYSSFMFFAMFSARLKELTSSFEP